MTILCDSGDWPDEFIKRDLIINRTGTTYATGHQSSTGNVRSVFTGAVFRLYEEIEDLPSQTGRSNNADTFSAYARSGYHPNYPATPELEMKQARTAEFLHNEKGLVLAGEGLVEGLQDVVDYSAIAIRPDLAVKSESGRRMESNRCRCCRCFQGQLLWAGWYELRNPNQVGNWLGVWRGLLGLAAARTTVRLDAICPVLLQQNLIWAQVADAKVHNVKQKGRSSQ
jgi:hypothetical protein